MARVPTLDSPPLPMRIAGLAALIAAVGLVIGMIFLAQRANRDQSFVNWFGLATALGGAAAFELFKHGMTVRKRFLEELADEITLTPMRREELGKLMSEVAKNRELYDGLTTVIELRAKELAVERDRQELQQRAKSLASDLQELEEREHRLALERTEAQSNSMGAELEEVIEKLNEPQRELVLRIASSISRVTPLGPLVLVLTEGLYRELDRFIARRKRRRTVRFEAELKAKNEPKK